jgi:hypothetical protein
MLTTRARVSARCEGERVPVRKSPGWAVDLLRTWAGLAPRVQISYFYFFSSFSFYVFLISFISFA